MFCPLLLWQKLPLLHKKALIGREKAKNNSVEIKLFAKTLKFFPRFVWLVWILSVILHSVSQRW